MIFDEGFGPGDGGSRVGAVSKTSFHHLHHTSNIIHNIYIHYNDNTTQIDFKN